MKTMYFAEKHFTLQVISCCSSATYYWYHFLQIC